MIRFCTKAGTKQPENTAPLLYRSRQQMEADRQVSRSLRVSKATVIRAALGEEEREWKTGFQLAAAYALPIAPFLPLGARSACQLFQKVTQLLGENCWWSGKNNFLGFAFRDTTPELPEKTLGARGAGPWGQGRSGISRVRGTGAPTPPGHLRTVSCLFLAYFWLV